MTSNTESLTRKRNKLKASAAVASTLAHAERELADQQHLVAHNLERLADDLSGQVKTVEAELKSIENDGPSPKT
jgi:heme oxygenase